MSVPKQQESSHMLEICSTNTCAGIPSISTVSLPVLSLCICYEPKMCASYNVSPPTSMSFRMLCCLRVLSAVIASTVEHKFFASHYSIIKLWRPGKHQQMYLRPPPPPLSFRRKCCVQLGTSVLNCWL